MQTDTKMYAHRGAGSMRFGLYQVIKRWANTACRKEMVVIWEKSKQKQKYGMRMEQVQQALKSQQLWDLQDSG